MRYVIRCISGLSIDEVTEKLIHALESEGFIVLTEIDLKATLKKKCSVDIYPYHVLIVFNHIYFYELVKCHGKTGLLLPCNIVIKKANDHVEVISIDPITYRVTWGNGILDKIASAIQTKIGMVIERF